MTVTSMSLNEGRVTSGGGAPSCVVDCSLLDRSDATSCRVEAKVSTWVENRQAQRRAEAEVLLPPRKALSQLHNTTPPGAGAATKGREPSPPTPRLSRPTLLRPPLPIAPRPGATLPSSGPAPPRAGRLPTPAAASVPPSSAGAPPGPLAAPRGGQARPVPRAAAGRGPNRRGPRPRRGAVSGDG